MNKVTIIIPVYNKKDFIIDALDSCINQTYKDFEIIIIDDCSKDGSLQLVKDFTKTNRSFDIKVFQNEQNRGVSYSRNYGIKMATGEYVMFLDADDILHPEALSIMLNYITECNADLVFSKRNFFSDNYAFETYNNKVCVGHLISPTQIITGGIIRKHLIDQYMLFFEETLKNGEDTLFAAQIFCVSNKRLFIEFPFYLMRRNVNQSLSHGQWNNPDMEIPREKNILRYIEKYYETGIFQTTEQKAEAIKVIRTKKNAVKGLLTQYAVNDCPAELKYRVRISDIVSSHFGTAWKALEIAYQLPLMESLFIFRILAHLKTIYVKKTGILE